MTNTWDAVEDAWYWADQKTAPGPYVSWFKDNRNDPAVGLPILEPYINASRARSYGTGLVSFQLEFSSEAVLASFVAVENARFADQALVSSDTSKPAFVVLKIESPYIFTKAQRSGRGAARSKFRPTEARPLPRSNSGISARRSRAAPLALVRVGIKSALRNLKLDVLVQNNPGSLPYLSPGKNVVTVSVASPAELGNNKLVVTYAYRLGSRTKSFDQLRKEGKKPPRQHNAKWSDTVTFMPEDIHRQRVTGQFRSRLSQLHGASIRFILAGW